VHRSYTGRVTEHRASDSAWVRGLVDAHFVAAYTAEKQARRREPTDLEIADYILSNFAHVPLSEHDRRKATLEALADVVAEHWEGLDLAPPATS
jgi:hypothetical protein